MNRVIEIGNAFITSLKNNSRSGRVYDISGLSPTLTTPSGGGIIPLIKEKNEQDNCCGEVLSVQTGCDCRPARNMPDITRRRHGGGTSVVEFDEETKIRRLTPRECFRLQGWTDDYFDKAEFVNSDNQLYRQAGNGVSVPVVQAIAERMGIEED